jgi:Helix-turn-helix domain
MEGAVHYCGLCEGTLYKLVKDKLITSSNVILPGNSRGRRLIKRSSLDEFIEAGIGAAPSELKMNQS